MSQPVRVTNEFNNCTETLMRCPYNESHMVSAARFQFHVTKCAKSAKNTNKKVCPFNTTHLCDSTKLDEHVKNCPDRALFDNTKYQVGECSANNVEITMAPTSVFASEENWSLEEQRPYNPQEYLQNNSGKILKPLRGVTPSERKAHRMQLRRNFQTPKPQ